MPKFTHMGGEELSLKTSQAGCRAFTIAISFYFVLFYFVLFYFVQGICHHGKILFLY